MKKIVFLLSSALLLLSATSFAADKKASELKIISYNIRLGSANDGTNSWRFRYPATLSMIDDQKPDMMGLQEALTDQLETIDLWANGKYKHVGVGRDDGKSAGEHMAIYYNPKTIKILKWGTFWLSETPDEPSYGWDAACRRTATWVIAKHKKSGKKVLYVNTHLDHKGPIAQQKGLELILEKVKELDPDGKYPTILTGDLNLPQDNPSIVYLGTMMTSAREMADETDSHHSFNGWGKSKQWIDYIFYNGFSKCRKFETITKQYEKQPFISDHFPISAIFEL